VQHERALGSEDGRAKKLKRKESEHEVERPLESEDEGPQKLRRKEYERELARLHLELVKLQHADDKRRARLNCIAHVVDSIDYSDMLPRPLKLGRRPHRVEYRRPPRGQNTVILTKY